MAASVAPLKFLALDQSSRTTGYAIFSKDGALEKYGTFSFTDSDLGTRLWKIRDKILKLIYEYDIEQVVFEDIQMQDGNLSTFKILAEVFGVVQEMLTEIKMPYDVLAPTVWRSRLKFKGDKTRAAQKKKALVYVEERFAVTPTEDAAEAICIGCAHLAGSDIISW